MYNPPNRFARPTMIALALTAITAIAAALTPSGRCAPEANPEGSLRVEESKTGMNIRDVHRLILSYRHNGRGTEYKPYMEKLYSPAGVQVLRDSPSDHKHHHALMFALSVDGVNFWEESKPENGRERFRSGYVKNAPRDNVERAGFVETVDWVAPAPDRTVLVERREITAFQAPDLGATLIEWRCRLEAPPGKDSAVLTGAHYNGLGLRFLKSMDSGGRFFNSDHRQGEVVRGDERLTPAKWCAYTAKADGHQVTVALFDHPNNLRYPAKMFTMTKPFAYLSATLNEWKEPVEVKAGKPLNLCYGVALWDGEKDKATVEKLYKRWLEISGSDQTHKE